jgi:hypothetical protein
MISQKKRHRIAVARLGRVVSQRINNEKKYTDMTNLCDCYCADCVIARKKSRNKNSPELHCQRTDTQCHYG